MQTEFAPAPAEVNRVNPEEIIDQYHALGPLADPSTLPLFDLETRAATVLSHGEQNEPLMWLARQTRNERLGSDTPPDDTLEAASMLLDSVNAINSPAGADAGYKNLLKFSLSRLLPNAARNGETGQQRAEANARFFDYHNWLERNNELLDHPLATHQDRAQRYLEGIISQRNVTGEQGLSDGFTFEVAVTMMADYKLWQEEAHDAPDGFARMATRREDQPHGIPRQKGTRVAHDVVLQLGDDITRVQCKLEPEDPDHPDHERYDLSVITMVRDDLKKEEVTALLKDVQAAYKDDAKAAERIDAKLLEYGLLDRIETYAKRYHAEQASGRIAVAAAANN